MKQLIAISPILFENINYEPGDELPIHNTELITIWVENKAAVWKDIGEPVKKTVKAKSVTAPMGLSGDAYPCAGLNQDLIGKPPERKARGIIPEPCKGRRKSSA